MEKCGFNPVSNSKNGASKKTSELMNLEAEFAKKHKRDTDEELIDYIRDTLRKGSVIFQVSMRCEAMP